MDLVEFAERYFGVEFTEYQKEYIRKLDEKGRNNMTETKTHLIEDKTIGGVKREYIEVEREANVGDRIVIVNAAYTGGTYRDGDILSVSDDCGRRSVICKDIANEENYNGQIDAEEFRTLDPTDIVHIDGTRYQLAERKAKVGEKVLVVDWNVDDHIFNDISKGELLTVAVVDQDGDIWKSNEREHEAVVTYRGREYRVLTPAKPTFDELVSQITPENKHEEVFAEPTPDIHDLLANLAQRVTALERITGELVRAKSSVESQLSLTQNNVERLAQELEREKEFRDSIYLKVSDLKDEVESNTKDIAFLDECTFEKPGKPTKSAEEILREISKILERDECL